MQHINKKKIKCNGGNNMYPYNLQQNKVGDKEIKIMADEKNDEMNNKADEKILDMLIIALKNENEDKNYYKSLMERVSNEEDAKIINQISLDEKKHYNYLMQIYKRLTGQTLSLEDEQVKLQDNLVDNFAKSIFDEIEAVEFYRRLMFIFLDLQIRDMIYEIITDEQAHATKMNYLFSKYNDK